MTSPLVCKYCWKNVAGYTLHPIGSIGRANYISRGAFGIEKSGLLGRRTLSLLVFAPPRGLVVVVLFVLMKEV